LDTNLLGFFMTKYHEQFKLAVVQQYLSGTAGYKLVAKQHGLGHSMLRKWVSLHRLHGSAGLAKKSSHYDAEFRLSVLQHMWDGELSYGQVAAVFNIRSSGSISQWERCYHSGGIDALIPRSRGKPNKMPTPQDTKPPLPPDGAERTRDELVAEVNHLRMEVAYLKKLQALVQSQQQRATARKKRK
jgi:transposase